MNEPTLCKQGRFRYLEFTGLKIQILLIFPDLASLPFIILSRLLGCFRC